MTKSVRAAIPPNLRLRWGGRFASEEDVAWHSHAEIELVLITAGACDISVGTHRLKGTAGAIFVLPAIQAQYQHTHGLTHTTFIGFDAPPGWFDDRPRVLMPWAYDPVQVWMEQLCDWPILRPAPAPDLARQLLELLLRRVRELDRAEGAPRHPAVSRVMDWVEANPAQTATLDDLARIAGVSASHLGALFAADTGGGPLQYLQRRRMERAAWLLDNPYLRVHEVAAACGFEDVNYFVRLFRRHHGQPPGRWRRVKPTTRS